MGDAMANREEPPHVPADDRGALKPWEQHSAVISIPRFDYKAPSSLLQRPHSGFLVSCPIKREKSATKEAISIFEKFLKPEESKICQIRKSEHDLKRRKICSKEMDGVCVPNTKEKSECCVARSSAAGGAILLENVARKIDLSLVKLRKNGLLLFTFLDDDVRHAVNVLSRILFSLESGDLKRPQWCFRIFPIQEICTLKETNLHMVVSKLVLDYIDGEGKELKSPIRFAIVYDRRGADENKNTPKAVAVDGVAELDLLDRNVCFKVVAKAVKDVAVDSVVDLKSPELIVRVELLPVSGLPAGSIIAGVSVLPQHLVSIKPRGLCVKALVSDS